MTNSNTDVPLPQFKGIIKKKYILVRAAVNVMMNFIHVSQKLMFNTIKSLKMCVSFIDCKDELT